MAEKMPTFSAGSRMGSQLGEWIPPLPCLLCAAQDFEKHGWQPCLSTAVWNCLWYLAVFINIRRVNEAPRHPANTPCYTAISLSLSTKELLGSCLRPSSLPHRPQGASQRPPACTQLPATTEGDLCDLLIFHKCTNRRGRI